jgi:hypothetical protein
MGANAGKKKVLVIIAATLALAALLVADGSSPDLR